MKRGAWARRVALTGLVVLPACSPSLRDPIGEEIWATIGGLCAHGCGSSSLHRDGNTLEYREEEDAGVPLTRLGVLTDAGLAEYVAASAELSENQTFETCSGADGIDARAQVLSEEGSFRVYYCVLGEPDPDVARLATFFSTVIQGLRDCTSNAWVDAC